MFQYPISRARDYGNSYVKTSCWNDRCSQSDTCRRICWRYLKALGGSVMAKFWLDVPVNRSYYEMKALKCQTEQCVYICHNRSKPGQKSHRRWCYRSASDIVYIQYWFQFYSLRPWVDLEFTAYYENYILMCQTWARIGSTLLRLAWYRPTSGTLRHVYRDSQVYVSLAFIRIIIWVLYVYTDTYSRITYNWSYPCSLFSWVCN